MNIGRYVMPKKRGRMQPIEKLRMLFLREQKAMIMRKYEKKPKTEKL